MRVVHVFKDYYPPTTGGIEQHMALLCSGLAPHADVSVLVPSRSRRRVAEYVDGVRVIRVPEFGRYAAVPLCPTMPAELGRLEPDIVHLHFPNPMGDVSYLLRGRRAALVVSYHADVIRQRALLPLYRPVLDALFARADRVIAGAPEYIASSALLTRHRAKCVVIPYGVRTAAFALRDGEAREVERVRAHYGAPLVLFVGVLRPYKGVDVLLDAMGGVPARALIVGHGPKREALESRARRLGLENRVAFLGEVPPARLRILLHACDAFVLPSIDRREAFGIAQLEAMACGRPVVASDLPTGIRLVNRHEETGLLVPPADPAALRGALNRLLGDPSLAARLGRAAQAQVERDFTAERMVAAVLALYHHMLRARAL